MIGVTASAAVADCNVSPKRRRAQSGRHPIKGFFFMKIRGKQEFRVIGPIFTPSRKCIFSHPAI